MPKIVSRILPVLEAFLVSIIWGSSFILVKLALSELGPLTISGLRYFLGFVILSPLIARNGISLSKMQWLHMALLGLFGYTLANGALFWTLQFLPATTVSFLMGSVSITTLLGGAILFNEIPNRFQFLGILVTLTGMVLFFQNGLKSGEPLGLAIFILALAGFTAFALLSRAVTVHDQIDALTLTALPLALGGGLMLVIAIHFEGIPNASYKTWGTILFLAAINTALGYLLYFKAIRFLQTFELNMMLNLAPIWTAILEWLLLGGFLVLTKWVGIAIVILGMFFIQKETAAKWLSPR